MTTFAEALADGPLVLDGGLGTLLEERGNDVTDALWSARILLDDPDEVRAAHAAFFASGARVAISASYQVGYEQLAHEGFASDEVDELLTRSVTLAREARTASGLDGSAWVAASVGPFGATRADGSEYTGDYGVGVDELRAWHRRRLAVLAASGADVLAVETVPSLDEVRAVVAELDALAASGSAVPAWIAVTVADGTLRSGEPVAEAFRIAASSDAVLAVGVNCCDPRDVAPALAAARAVTDKPLVAYPNSGEQWDAKNRRWMGRADIPSALVGEWLDLGARLVGGCCRVSPAAIGHVGEVVGAR